MKQGNKTTHLETKATESTDTKVNGAVAAYELGQIVNRFRFRVEALYVPSFDPEYDSITDRLDEGLEYIDRETARIMSRCDRFESSGIAQNNLQALRTESDSINRKCHELWNTPDHLSLIDLYTDIENSEESERKSRIIDAMRNSAVGAKFWEKYWRLFCKLTVSTPSPYDIFLLLGYIFDERFYLTSASYTLPTKRRAVSNSKSDNRQSKLISFYTDRNIIGFWWPKIQKSFELISRYGSFGEKKPNSNDQYGSEIHQFENFKIWLETNLKHFIPDTHSIINEIKTIKAQRFDQKSLLELIINLAQNPSRPTPKLLYLDLNLPDKFKLEFKSLTTGSKHKCRKEKINEKLKKLTEHYKSYPGHFFKTKESCQYNSSTKSIPEPEIIQVLFYKDKACRIIYPNAKHIIKFLEDFEKKDWPSRIEIPAGKDDEFNHYVLLDACRSFKRDSEHLLLRVHTQDSKLYVIWEETTESKES